MQLQSIIIAHGQTLMRIGLEVLVKELFGSMCDIILTENANEIISLSRQIQSHMLILDAHLPNTNVFAVVAAIIKEAPSLKILIIGSGMDDILATNFLKMGVLGFTSKNFSIDEFNEAIVNVYKGKRFISENQSQFLLNGASGEGGLNPFLKLSVRELEVCSLLLLGNGSLEIGNALSINASTASTYKGRIFEKLNIKNIIELNILASKYEVFLHS